MSDDRWEDVQHDVAAAERHFRAARTLYDRGGFDGAGLDGYAAQMAFLHAMQSAHTSFEAALLRILDMLGEVAPSGADWHADLIRRAGRARPDVRPAILTPELTAAAEETRKFRHRAARAYDDFRPDLAVRAVAAADRLAAELARDIAAFRTAIDP